MASLAPPPRFAGVMPYAYNHRDELFLLLSREAFGRERGSWSGFAGGVLPKDGGDIVAAAAREAYEESSGLLGSPAILYRLLLTAGRRLDVSSGVHFLLPIQYNTYLPFMFQGVQHALRGALFPVQTPPGAPLQYSPMLEKDSVRWFSAEDLLSKSHTDVNFRHGFKKDIQTIIREIQTNNGIKLDFRN
jgi:hypothetical protein